MEFSFSLEIKLFILASVTSSQALGFLTPARIPEHLWLSGRFLLCKDCQIAVSSNIIDFYLQ